MLNSKLGDFGEIDKIFDKINEKYGEAFRRMAKSEREERLNELLSECTPENAHEEVDWGSPHMVKVGFKRLNDNAVIPTKAHPTDSGFDLYASEDVIIEPGKTVVVPTGIAVELPKGFEAQVRPRSGVTAKTKLRVHLGTIDNGYKGEIGVIVDNIRTPIKTVDVNGGRTGMSSVTTTDAYTECGTGRYMGKRIIDGKYVIRKGDRIAQLVVQALPAVTVVEIDDFTEDSERGEGGFGSTGV